MTLPLIASFAALAGLTACAAPDPKPSMGERVIDDAFRRLETTHTAPTVERPRAEATVVEVLANGARLVSVDRPRLPLVTIALYTMSGRCADAEQAGRTQLAMRHLFKGHASKSGKTWSENAVEQHIDTIGAKVSAQADSEWSRITLSVPQTESTTDHVDFLFDAWTAPNVNNQVFARERQRTLNELERWERDPGYLGELAYRKALLGGHPYQLGYGYGTRETLGGLDPRHIEQRLEALRAPNAVTAFVIGPNDATVLDRVRRRLGALPSAPRQQTGITAPSSSGPQLVEVVRPGMDQIGLTFGAMGQAARSSDRLAFEVMARMLTGGFTSALVDELRVNRGLTYGISLRQSWLALPSPYAFRTSTRAEKSHELLTIAFEEIVALARGEFDDQLLLTAKNLLATDLAATTETQIGTANAMFVGQLHLDDPMAHAKRIAGIAAITRTDVLRVAGQLDPAQMTIVAVGDADRLKAADLGSVTRPALAARKH